MKWMRVLIILMMGVIMFFMVSCPGMYDSKRMARARYNYRYFPGPAAEKELKDAKGASSKVILISESFFAVVVISMGLLFYKIGKKPD